MLFEAVMTQYWKKLCTKRQMKFIPIDDDALLKVEHDSVWRRGGVPWERFPRLAAQFQALDFSDLMLFCREDFPADIAYTIAALLGETPGLPEGRYRHIPPKNSPVTYSLVRQELPARASRSTQAPNVTIARQR